MNPVDTRHTTGIYTAPPGHEDKVGDLPYWRTGNDLGGTSVWSAWEPSAEELAVLNAGGRVLVGIVGEPIPPISVGVFARDGEPETETLVVHSRRVRVIKEEGRNHLEQERENTQSEETTGATPGTTGEQGTTDDAAKEDTATDEDGKQKA